LARSAGVLQRDSLALLTTVWILEALGMSLNTMTLGGLVPSRWVWWSMMPSSIVETYCVGGVR